MIASSSSPLARVARAAAVAITLLSASAVTAATAAAASAESPSLPSPRIGDLHARVLSLPARVAALHPRVLSVAPEHTRANAFSLNSDVLFAFGRSTLTSNAQAVLRALVSRLHKAKRGSVSIVGYTDSIGTPRYNLGLSRLRATSVEEYLRADVHNPGLSYHAKGLGEADPVAPNKLPNGQDNAAGRQKNRRVVVTYR
ncbi:MAG TPA: OmpA family protein [Solirubrobacteraceae bacterium]